MITSTQIMQYDVGLHQREEKCSEILLRAEKEADQVVLDVLSAIADHDANGIKLKAEAASLRAARGEKRASEQGVGDNQQPLKAMVIMPAKMTTPPRSMTTTANQTTANYRRPQLARSISTNLVLSSNDYATAFSHCIKSSSCRAMYITGWVN